LGQVRYIAEPAHEYVFSKVRAGSSQDVHNPVRRE
jgi:hypothetical protein